MRRAPWAAAVIAALALVAPARAWETATTHAGFTEQAALASKLHQRLIEQFGVDLGLYGQLVIPPKDAPALFSALDELNPTHGYVPDKRGRQSALEWLVAGSVIADMPVAAARNHFFDPTKGIGLVIPSGLPGSFIGTRLALRYVGKGDAIPAIDWIESKDNPLDLEGFFSQYRKAVLAHTRGERDRHLAGALLAAGALLHVLQDMGSPSHVRNDFAAHLTPLSDDPSDVGSRFERIAALAYGRLGVAPATRVVERKHLRDFFTGESADGIGLADWTAARFFSRNTLPESIALPRDARARDLGDAIARALRRPNPAPLATGLDLIRAAQPDGATLIGADGVCIARYRVRDYELTWNIDDQCALDQIGAIMPEVSAYSTGLLQFLFRGALAISKTRNGSISIAAADVALGKGTITVLWDDARGVRTQLGDPAETAGGAPGASLVTAGAPPAGARFVAALFDGVDANGERVVATGLLSLSE